MTDGKRLKSVLQNHGYTATDVAKIINRSPAGVYYYFGQSRIKRRTVELILNTLNIPLSNFYSREKKQRQAIPDSRNEGRSLQNLLIKRGITYSQFAKNTNISRPTLYRYFEQVSLDPAYKLLACKELNIDPKLLERRHDDLAATNTEILKFLVELKDRIEKIEEYIKSLS